MNLNIDNVIYTRLRTNPMGRVPVHNQGMTGNITTSEYHSGGSVEYVISPPIFEVCRITQSQPHTSTG